MTRSLQELAREALAVQDACNLCAVALGFGRALVDLGEHTHGTDERNRHPIAIVWADKIAHLTGTQTVGLDVVMAAYCIVQDLAAGDRGAVPAVDPPGGGKVDG
jgi:hypothetical protein